ncbi:hypothetical protein QVD17_16350 [Tagetes erecta]|uniref:Uncharacterized protein n=1 Tax=Tagetes erecta TaxID=13708 RepID=A0AAD8KU35_TARER|nr:hypothetical protein QVD17_16350 [Tagetes erecta]
MKQLFSDSEWHGSIRVKWRKFVVLIGDAGDYIEPEGVATLKKKRGATEVDMRKDEGVVVVVEVETEDGNGSETVADIGIF